MGRLEKLITLKDLSIKKSFIVLVFVVLCITVICIILEFELVSYLEDTIKIKSQVKIYNRVLVFVVILTVLIAIIIGSIIFYKIKLKHPLKIILDASERIKQNDLNFKVFYSSNDEFGELCRSFEEMRFTLENNFLQVWENDSRQKKFIAAFIHDIRTPITILNGYIEIMENYLGDEEIVKEKYKSSLEKMKIQISKIENYSEKTHSLQDNSDYLIIEVNEFDKKDFINKINESKEALMINRKKDLFINLRHNNLYNEKLNIDISNIIRVFDNIFVNSLRYANNIIEIDINFNNEYIIIKITDDGSGFSQEDLLNAKKAFYKGKDGKYGIGLYISNILCEVHGGRLEVYNSKKGGAEVIAYFKQIDN